MVTDLSLGYGLVVMFFSSVLCSSAGVGGGSLNVPILYSIIGFDYDTAVILSLCTLMGNYLLQVLVNLDKRHPSEPKMPLIYWDAVLIMLPSELGGANFGVILAKSMPKTIVFILAIVVLIIAIYFSSKKGLRLYDKETLLIQAELDSKNEEFFSSHARSPLLTDSHPHNRSEMDTSVNLNETALPTRIVAKRPPPITLSSIFPPYLCCYYRCCKSTSTKSHKSSSPHSALGTSEISTSYDEEDAEHDQEPDLPPIEFPWPVIAMIGAVFVLYVACYVIQKQYNQCSTGSYICLTIIYVLLIFQVTWGLRHLTKQYEAKINTAWVSDTAPKNSGLVDGEIHWGLQSAVVPLVSFLIGVTSALLGIGGGELMGPMLLVFKVLAPVSTATTSFMSLLNTSSSVLHYIVLGDLPFGYGAAVFGVGALGGVTGRVLALYFVAFYRRASLLILSLVGVLCCSIFIYGYYLIDSKTELSFSSMCS